ncbi:serine/threonine-protein kinase Chk2-like isoform X2 [Xenia sp. Carnegie-2017]|uniref:serine/threonine-protein kinase Chk2-like isoform X2 n=1 Tax=Xenia sp. Carnegie-2017 TaxID=2897299 RepID=UPI001F03BF2F|nr:serine/threonine-protein kinase Chk2-like isoform X2 [Xenia sp. Carnegie-2017]
MGFTELETSDSGAQVAIIEDFSSNGTYINGVRVGQGNRQVIVDNDKICLPTQDHTAYIFQDLKTIFTEEATFPREIREKYTIFKFLGSGVCGHVHHAFTKGRECKGVAIKVITKAKFASQSYSNRTSIFQEVAVLKKLNHPCIVKYIDAVNTTDKLFIVLELVEGGELYDRIVKQKRLDERVTKFYFYQMLVAVKYLHEEGFTHRDLKPENVLLSSFDEETLVKITDFGLSKFVGEQSLMQTLCGTPSYLAPEVLSSNGVLSYKKDCDCWSLGVILYVCLSGGAPFTNTPENPLTKQIISGAYSFSNHCWRNVSGEAKDLIKKLMTVDPNQRITVAQALEHPWMKDDEIIEKANMLMNGLSIAGDMSQPSTTAIKRIESDAVIDNSVTKKQKPSDDYEDKTFVL